MAAEVAKRWIISRISSSRSARGVPKLIAKAGLNGTAEGATVSLFKPLGH